MGTSGKAARQETSSTQDDTEGELGIFHASITFISQVFSFALLGSVAFCVPVAEPDAKADPFLPVVTYGAPLVYHAPNCTTEEEVIQIKKCAPMTENECEDIEVPAQKLEYTLKCQNVTRTHCSNGLTTINADEPAAKEKRDAEPDADPQLLLHPVVPLLKHTCVDTVQEHCFQEPKITEVSNTVQRCLVKTTVECEDVDHTIPKTVCDHTAPVTYIG